MIASFHLADVGKRAGLRLLRTRLAPGDAPGLRYGVLTMASPLSASRLPRPSPGRVALIAAWEDEHSLQRFLAEDRLAAALRDGWRAFLEPTHIFGAFPPLDGLVDEDPRTMSEEEPAAALTIGHLRLSQAQRFLKAGAEAERLAAREEAMVRGTGLARPPKLVATFSLWRTTREMRAYAGGGSGPEHRAAVKAHAKRPFHHASAFIRFRPYAMEGEWDGAKALASEVPAPTALT